MADLRRFYKGKLEYVSVINTSSTLLFINNQLVIYIYRYIYIYIYIYISFYLLLLLHEDKIATIYVLSGGLIIIIDLLATIDIEIDG